MLNAIPFLTIQSKIFSFVDCVFVLLKLEL